MDYKQYWDKIYEQSEEFNSLLSDYWNQYSDMGNWQFWIALSLLVLPLIILYFTVDRKRIFELFFFGYTLHILWTYMTIVLERYSYFVHKYFLVPFLPFSLSLAASLFPVCYILLYQYCTNNKKNFHMYNLGLSAVLVFGFASVELFLGLIEFRKGMNLFHLFLIALGISLISYWFTKIIFKMSSNLST